MNAGKAVYGILSANTGVTDIVGTRIFPEIAEQEAVTPFVVYQLLSVDPEDTHDGPSKLDEVRFEFLCYADSYNAAADLGVAVRAALDRVSGTYNGVNVESVQFNDVDVEIEYDPRRYSQVLKFTFRIKRDDIEIALGTPVTGAQLAQLSDVNATSLAEGNILKYDESESEWVNASLPILTTGSLTQSEASGYTILSIDSNPSFNSVQSSGDVTISGDILLVGASTKLIRPLDVGQATGPLTIQSNGDLIIELDQDDNEPYKALIIKNGGNTEVFKVDEAGSVTVNQEYVLPTTDGGTDYFLKTDGSGQLYFATLYGTSGNTGAAPPPAIDTIAELLDTQISSLADDQILRYDSTSGKWLNEDLEALPAGGTTGQALVKASGTDYDVEWADIAVDVQYHDRFQTDAETFRSGATDTVELYYTAKADGDGLSESASSDTPTSGFDIRRKLYYAEKAFADPDTSGDWTQFTAIADNTTFANAKGALLAYLKERTGGTVPISLKMTWEEVAEAPAFTGLLNETYGSGAAAAYSVRRLNGNYTGSAIQVERSSDNTTQDIGFDSNGDLDESALTTFCTGTVCKVRTWYDQSQTGGTGSGNDAVQTTHANQPTIYTGGAIVKLDGRAAVKGLGVSGGKLDFTTVSHTGNFSHYMLQTFQSNAMPYGGPSGHFWYHMNANTLRYRIDGASEDFGGYQFQNLQRFLHSGNRGLSAGNLKLAIDGIDNATLNASTQTFDLSTMYAGNGGGFPYSGYIQEFLMYDSSKSASDQDSIESNVGDYFTQNTPLLDTYTGAAAAYSLRKLRTAYSGSAIRVRRASDNTEQDIGFNVFGELDTVSLASFCSGTDGFVRTFYDQSGNGRDFAQTNTANQPKIYDGTTGVVIDNAKPAMEFDGANDTFNATSAFTINTDFLGAMVFNFTGANAIRMIHDSTNADRLSIFFCENLSTTFRPALKSGFSTESSGQNITLSTQTIITAHKSGTQAEAFANGQSNGASTVNNPATSLGGLAFSSYGGLKFTGKIQEIIFYGDDQSSDRANIETNLNDFYGAF